MNKINKQVFIRAFLVWLMVFVMTAMPAGCGETISYNSGDGSETEETEGDLPGNTSKDASGNGATDGSSEDSATEPVVTEAVTGTEQEKAVSDTDGVLCVFVCGAVKNEGVYYLQEGSRYNDALAAAGGFAGDADTSGVNLAAFVSDGEKVYFPHEGEVVAGGGNLSTDDGQSAGSEGTSAGGPNSGSGSVSDGRVNINTASEEELTGLSGIGQKKARAIVEYREQNGDFGSIDEIKNVNGIGDALYQKIKDSICI